MALICPTPIYDPFPVADPPQVAPEPEYHAPFCHTTHGVLQRGDCAPGSSQDQIIELKVFDGSTGFSVPLTLRSTDTAETLIQRYLQMRPELTGSLHLAYNGKQVRKKKSLGELGVKPGATFITYQKCVGG